MFSSCRYPVPSFAFFFCFFFGVGFSHVAYGDCKKLKVLTHPHYPPFHYTNKEGRLQGPSLNFAKHVADHMGLPLEVLAPLPWQRVQEVARRGEVDAIVFLKRTTDREQYLDFVDFPIHTNAMVIYTRAADKKATASIGNWIDLSRFSGAKSAGDNFGKEFDDFSEKLKLGQAKDPEALFKMLLSQRVDYIAIGRATGRSLAKKLKAEDQVEEKLVVNTGPVFLAFSKKSACAPNLKDLEKHFKELAAQSKLKTFFETD